MDYRTSRQPWASGRWLGVASNRLPPSVKTKKATELVFFTCSTTRRQLSLYLACPIRTQTWKIRSVCYFFVPIYILSIILPAEKPAGTHAALAHGGTHGAFAGSALRASSRQFPCAPSPPKAIPQGLRCVLSAQTYFIPTEFFQTRKERSVGQPRMCA